MMVKETKKDRHAVPVDKKVRHQHAELVDKKFERNYAMMAHEIDTIDTLLDSGASRHMVNNKSLFGGNVRSVQTQVMTAGAHTLASPNGSC